MLETHTNKTVLETDPHQSKLTYPHVANETSRFEHLDHLKTKRRKNSNDQIDLAATMSHANFWALLSQIQTGWIAQTQAGQHLFRRLPSCASIFEIMTHAIETLAKRSDSLETLVLVIAERQAELHVQKHLRLIDKLVLSVFSDSARVGILTKTDLIYLRRMPR